MSLLKCPKCGEMFSDSYKTCPFCQEDEEFYNGKKKPKNPGRRVHQNKAPSIIGPAMVVVVLLLAGFLVYTFLGSDIANLFKGDDKPQTEQSDPVVTPPVKDEDEDKDKEVVTITLDQTKTELKVGESAALKATGAEKVTWTSSDTAVATVDASGKVTAVAAGTATITAAAEGATSATCEVTVTAPPKKLEVVSIYGPLGVPNEAFTMGVGEEVPLLVEGTDSKPEWKITEGADRVSVDSNGVVKRSASGNATLEVKVDGQTIVITIN